MPSNLTTRRCCTIRRPARLARFAISALVGQWTGSRTRPDVARTNPDQVFVRGLTTPTTSRPPGASTLANSARAASGSGNQWNDSVETTASIEPERTGSLWASA